ncbi:MAG: glycosyltransferase [Candidatus Eremiobacteraeota bacterium]|nr:glycosyltransferase [Candidatus Eremiobacteraeota bacterium]MBV9647232.1 glycosyltransferase [Candidatus Eremiobacteraeota bacterium]
MMLSVVIATRNRAAQLSDALDSLTAQQEAPPFEIVVSDNGSTDGTADVVAAKRASFKGDLRRVFVAAPNRAAARNRAVQESTGDVVVFVDDDVVVPMGFLRAHATRHEAGTMRAVSGPIIVVASPRSRPRPTLANASRAFFCTCNVSVTRLAFDAAGRFDERFDLYGWEDTDLGIRLRRLGTQRVFAWDAYLYHVKPVQSETLDDALRRATEKGRMGARLIGKDASLRTRLATGAHAANFFRAALFVPPWLLPWYERMARAPVVPGPLRAFARAQALDGTYVHALQGGLRAQR